jgi:hypothetical protein
MGIGALEILIFSDIEVCPNSRGAVYRSYAGGGN